MKRICIIGGGPAGMMSAAIAAQNQQVDVMLLEKNGILGKKLLITGKGRCNITNYADNRTIIKNFPGNGKFLYSALDNLDSYNLIKFLEANGLKAKIERGNRVFPVSDKSSDVVKTFEKILKNRGVKVILNTKVLNVLKDRNKIKGIKTTKELIKCDVIIIATGGLAYPATGSTGDGYRFALNLGHTVVEPKPSLVPLETEEKWVEDLQGLALKNVTASLYIDETLSETGFGEMLFTHFGVSGPIIISLSRKAVEALKLSKSVVLKIDLKPALDFDTLDRRICRDFDTHASKILKNALKDLLPKKLIPIVINLAELDPRKVVNQITRKERLRLLKTVKGIPLTIIRPRPWEEAIITNGGINVKEIDPRTMESKLIKNLFFAGEVIDIDGYTGGFNLQAAFSTGFTAGMYASTL